MILSLVMLEMLRRQRGNGEKVTARQGAIITMKAIAKHFKLEHCMSKIEEGAKYPLDKEQQQNTYMNMIQKKGSQQSIELK